MSLFKEFKEFALRGNMVDMAIGIVIGAAFSKVVNSLVNDIIMPPIGYLIGGIDFSSLALKLKLPGKEPFEITYGSFINTLIDFTIIAISIFCVIKLMNTLHKKKEEEPTEIACPECLMQIPFKAKKCGHCGSSLSGNT